MRVFFFANLTILVVLCCLSMTGCKTRERTASSTAIRSSGEPVESAKMPKIREALSNLTNHISTARQTSEVVESVNEFMSALGMEDEEILVGMLSSPKPEELSDVRWNLTANQVMEMMRKSDSLELSRAFMTIATAEDTTDIVRDYSIQHYLLSEEASLVLLNSESLSSSRNKVLDRIFENSERILDEVATSESTVFGTLLMGLVAVSDKMENAESKEMADMLSSHVKNALGKQSGYSTANKVSAIQVSSRLGIEEMGPVIASIAWNEEASLSERLSAIASLSNFPNQFDPQKLESISDQNGKLKSVVNDILDRYKFSD